MQIHNVYENQQSFVPTFTVSKDTATLPKAYVTVLSEEDLTTPATLQAFVSNNLFAEDLKKGPITIYGREGDNFEKVLVLYVKSLDAKKAFTTGRAHLKSISTTFKNVSDVALQLSNNLNQEFLNEYLYGVFVENYQWQRKSQPVDGEINQSIFNPVKNFQFVSTQLNIEDQYFKFAASVAVQSLYGRELINTRANIATCEWMAAQAQEFQQAHASNVGIEVIKGIELEQKGLNLHYAVGRASTTEPHLVILNYKGNPDQPDQKTALVGKGIVYDCGGLSLKQALTNIMHADKGGACSVFAAFRGVVELGLKVNLVCTLGLAENMIAGNAYRNSDIIKTYKGITVEILNTDAEGRNVLADALSYTQLNYKPQTVFDVATLTGACLVALGEDTSAVFSNDDELADSLVKISRSAYEPLHALPLTQFVRDNIVSDQGDIRNLGKAMWGGAGTAAAFLEKFIEKDTKWAHIDMAQACGTKGEQMPVRTIIEYIRQQI